MNDNAIAVKLRTAAQMLEMSPLTAYRLIQEGVIPSVRIPGFRGLRVPVDRLKEVINKLAEEQSTT